MNVLKRIGNFVWRTIQETIGLVWLVATAIVTFTVWIVFCAGMYLWILLGRILDLFCPNTWDDVAELLSAISDYLDKDKKGDEEVKEQEEL